MARFERIFGASCLLIGESCLILEVQKSHKWRRENDGRLIIGLGCIGGALEETESPVAALQREAREEIGCGLLLRSAGFTIEVSARGNVWTRGWTANDVRPILIWEVSEPGHVGNAKVAVYLGKPDGNAEPCDLPAIAFMDIDLMLRIGCERLSVDAAISGKAEVLQRETVPRSALLELVGTPKVFHSLYSTHRHITDRIIAQMQ
jgi:hypothetical protein